MEIKLDGIGRRFNREWIFEGIDYTFKDGVSHAILGHNGSGKSTLLQVLAGSLSPSSGTVTHIFEDKHVDIENLYPKISIAAPYLELVEELTLSEMVDFHFRFKRPLKELKAQQIISLLGLGKSASKPIRYFSSGMKQRTKLALALCVDTSLVLLDEPASNLDHAGTVWYKEMIREFGKDRTVIVCSNQEIEYDFCASALKITDYKRTT